ncbi:hypothetical protein CNBA7280 [Cryptococcus deneoformans B-3501A]|uniref:NADH:ubiquinone oxidoreductase intermediate-associated protein 30 domain-containing protein n=1 Tax=Cryptococcus deneoformans (strain JEC21 / ATCC MYA-565) TaxID=214684 RepID=Q5KN76_CRYD1|nr:hypothetical protein CNA07460 [Cryptococcus neoformans var. neoformans JEC21]XP_777607.1 hypothetical protein CNBA7280 [Cryptococcus neoformans var. neoformans B-3501A]AAW41242.1 hypothetical protein CNA07460 [Cryptococcus neoformans var. neoformans JEC21]EAL22960.1 hypothetical protein CNBA7280 [Cryptococcus neoformans var. neoformans B-3501A]
MAALRAYLERSASLIGRNAQKVARMELHPETGPQTIFSFTSSHQPVDQPHHFSTGSDAELGGLTTADLKLIPAQPLAEPTASPQPSYSHMAFYGYMSTAVPPAHAGKIRTGFAGFRNTSRSTLFGQDTWDLDMATHLRIVVAYRGWEGWRNRWVVNIGVDDRPRTDIFQHRLELAPSPLSTSSTQPLDPLTPPLPHFTTLHLPLSSFVLIKKGHVSPSPVTMSRSQIRTVGFALLGRDRDDVASPFPTATGKKGIADVTIGGWGRGSVDEAEGDSELKAMLEEDRLLGPDANAGSSMSGKTQPGGGYHRKSVAQPGHVAAAAPSPTPLAGAGEEAAVGEVKEGYYELCVKSVEAVKWDPELDEVESTA